MATHNYGPCPLSASQQMKLRDTSYDAVKAAFPKYSRRALLAWRAEIQKAFPKPTPTKEEAFQAERTKRVHNETKRQEKLALKHAMAEVERLQRLNNALTEMSALNDARPVKAPGKKGPKNNAVAVIASSDQHIDEPVAIEKVNGLNEYSLVIASARFQKLWRNSIKLLNSAQRDVKLREVILWLGGDSFSGDIHEDTARGCSLRPLEAGLRVMAEYRGGIAYLRKHLPKETNLKVIFSYGNHGRLTKKPMKMLAREHNLEWFMGKILADELANVPGIEPVVAESYHTYVDVFGMKVRFHHGDWMTYKGGTGGITIPVNKALNEWNKSKRADLDVFGHFHTYLQGSNFVSNGSLIGYSPYALSIKAAYEPPQQAFFLIDEDKGKTISAPIHVR